MKTPGVRSGSEKRRDAAKLEQLGAQAEAALTLLDSETADGIIGEHSDEYDTLIQGASAVIAMEWAVMKSHGLRQTRRSLKAGGQTLTMVLTLLHYAYALGVRKGRGEKGKARRAKSKVVNHAS